MRRVVGCGALALCLCAGVAEAQVARRPSRPYRGLFGGGPPPDPNRARQELTFTASVLAGYDDAISPGSSTAQIEPGQRIQSGYTGNGDASLRYFLGRTARSLSVDGRVSSTAYSGIGVDPSIGADLTVRGEADLGRRHRLVASQDFAYVPNLVIGAFEGLEHDVNPSVLPDSGDTGGFVEQRSWSSDSSVTIDRRWTSRQTAGVGYVHSRRTYLDGAGYDSLSHMANARYAWAFSRSWSLESTYRYSHSRYAEPSRDQQAGAPLTDHSIEFGGSYVKRLSPTRQIQLSAGGGATYVQTLSGIDDTPLEYWMPSGNGTVRVDVGRSWALSADYARGVTVLQGVTLQSFATNTASIRADGLFGSRVEGAFSVAYASGRSGGGSQPGRFYSYAGTAQLRYALARCCAASLNYDYYLHHLRDIGSLPAGFPPEYDRNAVRIGMTLWLPLYGSYIDRRRARPGTGGSD